MLCAVLCTLVVIPCTAAAWRIFARSIRKSIGVSGALTEIPLDHRGSQSDIAASYFCFVECKSGQLLLINFCRRDGNCANVFRVQCRDAFRVGRDHGCCQSKEPPQAPQVACYRDIYDHQQLQKRRAEIVENCRQHYWASKGSALVSALGASMLFFVHLPSSCNCLRRCDAKYQRHSAASATGKYFLIFFNS